MRIFLSGTRYFGSMVLTELRKRHEVIGVSAPLSDRLAALALGHDIPTIPAGTLNKETIPAGVELIVAAHSHDFIGEATRFRSKYGAIGYHPSLLPRHRGRDAIRWAVKMGDPVTGGTVYQLSNTVDGGDILAQEWCWIRPGDTARSLWERDLCDMGVRMLCEVVETIAAERAVIGRKQDEALATWEPAFGAAPLRRPDLLQLPDLTGST